tara:strand:+ start:1664 stop:2857 length:1194 start_codon:yes stop_codon:yes gene_type:complete
MTPISDALKLILDDVCVIDGVECCELNQSLGRVLAEDVISSVNVPTDDNSAMDGYAIHTKDASDSLTVSQRIAAGELGAALEQGMAARIFTGAAVPQGADAIVIQENCNLNGDQLTIDGEVAVGQHIRPRGQDVKVGQKVMAAGVRLRAQELGVLASVGKARVNVWKKLKIAVLSTGSELVEPGIELGPGKIYNSNRYTLIGLLMSLGFEVLDMGIVPDSAVQTRKQLSLAAQSADCVISSGGMSVGEEDHVKAQVESLGELKLWKLKIKPGKPLAYGRIANTPFFGLPGNPAAVFVTFCLIARPYLLATQGVEKVEPTMLSVEANFEWPEVGSRQEYLRANISARGNKVVAEIHTNQSSGVLSSASWGNALVVIPPGETVQSGDFIKAILLSELLG